MAHTSGVQTKAACKRPAQTSAWGTEATGDTTCQIPFKSESLTNVLTFDDLEALEGLAGRSDTDIVAENPGGTVTADLWYAGLEYLFAAAFGFQCPTVYTGVYGTGSGGSPAPDHATPKAFHHMFELDDTLHRVAWSASERAVSSGSAGDATFWDATHLKVRCADISVDKGDGSSNYWRFLNSMVRSMTVRATLQECTIEFDVGGYKFEVDAVTGTWALPANARTRAVFPHLVVGLSAAGASAPTAVAVKEVTLTLTNPLIEDWESGGGKYKSEPIRSGPRTVTGAIKLARYTSQTFPTALRAETDFQFSMAFTGTSLITNVAGTLASATMYPLMQFICPLVRFTKADFPVTGPGVIEGDIEFDAFPVTAPAWVTTLAGGITIVKNSELYLMLRNNRGWNWLRDNHTGSPGTPGVLP